MASLGGPGLGGTPLVSSQRLLCSSCGAPYPAAETREVLLCAYCGTAQRMVDAREFLDHLLAQVNAFVQQAVPAGVDLSGAGGIDPVARGSLFASSVGPRLATEGSGLRFRFFSLLAHPLVALPFSLRPDIRLEDDPKQVTLFGAKVKSVANLAVSEGPKRLVDESARLATGYACTLVAARLLGESKPERFHLAQQNLTAAREALGPLTRWEPVADRLRALAEACAGIDAFRGGGFPVAAERLDAARAGLVAARTASGSQFELSYQVTAIDQELLLLAAVRNLVGFAAVPSGTSAVPPLVWVEAFNRTLDELAHAAGPSWQGVFGKATYQKEVTERLVELRRAQAGTGSVRVVTAGAGVLVPYWLVDLAYTFETGALWRKQAKVVPQPVLVAATFPLDPGALALARPSGVLTDVFTAGRGPGGLGQMMQQVSGRQASLSATGDLARVVAGVQPAPVNGRPAIPPLATGGEAVLLVQQYLNQVKASDPRLGEKLRLSSPRVVDLIYLPTNLAAGHPPLPWLGPLSPRSVGDPAALQRLIA